MPGLMLDLSRAQARSEAHSTAISSLSTDWTLLLKSRLFMIYIMAVVISQMACSKYLSARVANFLVCGAKDERISFSFQGRR